NFKITVADRSAVLIVSFIGYNVQEVTVGDRSAITITLTPAMGALNSVVVTALGIKREARSLGYSAQTVAGQDLIKADPPNVSEGLMGKVSGLNISVTNAVEGGSTRIVIRGNNNLWGNNQPLIVVPNVVVDNEPMQPGGKIQSNIDALNQGNTDVSQPPTDYGSF